MPTPILFWPISRLRPEGVQPPNTTGSSTSFMIGLPLTLVLVRLAQVLAETFALALFRLTSSSIGTIRSMTP